MSVALVVDKSPIRLHLRLSMWTWCIVCRRISENRRVCVHESACMEIIPEEDATISKQAPFPPLTSYKQKEDRRYTSKMLRSFFSCPADEEKKPY